MAVVRALNSAIYKIQTKNSNGFDVINAFTEESQAWVFSSLIFSSTNQRSRLSMAALQPPPLAPNHSNYIYPKNDIISNH